jgi:hypothetical protein
LQEGISGLLTALEELIVDKKAGKELENYRVTGGYT